MISGNRRRAYRKRLLLRPRLFRRFDHLLLELARHLFVMAEIFRVNAAAAGERAKLARVPVELLRGNFGADDLKLSIHIDAENPPAPARQIAHDLAHAVFGNAHLDGEDRLEQAWPRFLKRLLERPISGDLKRDVVRIDRVHFSIVKIDADIDHALALEDALGARDVDAFL